MSKETKGLLLKSASGRVPDYYYQKREAEKKAGRALTNAEFENDWLVTGGGSTLTDTGTSIFNPALCEILLAWYSARGDAVLDPFAGGSVRGIVAARMERRYTGVDLRPEQIAANEEQAAAIVPDNRPRWIVGDSLGIDALAGDGAPFDFLLTCPPYGDLEVYSDDPADLSTKGVEEFDAAYAEILRKSVAMLAPDRFAAVVVGNYRAKDGHLIDLAGKTVRAMEVAGAAYHNDHIVVQSCGSLPIRTRKQFLATRKAGRQHQFALVFCKGDARKAAARLGEPFLPEIAEEDTPPQ